MRTPTEYSNMIKEGYITKSVLSEVLYSINKRAKNYRDNKRKYKSNDRYDNFDKFENKEKEMYKMKDDILKKFTPIAIHKDTKIKAYKIKIYDYEAEFFYVKDKDVIREGSYFDKYQKEEVYFKVVEKTNKTELYFNYFEIGDYSFHIPISKENIDTSLEIKNLENFETQGADESDLLSLQFCKKVYEMMIDEKLKIKE